jgi:hypothetical protein
MLVEVSEVVVDPQVTIEIGLTWMITGGTPVHPGTPILGQSPEDLEVTSR